MSARIIGAISVFLLLLVAALIWLWLPEDQPPTPWSTLHEPAHGEQESREFAEAGAPHQDQRGSPAVDLQAEAEVDRGAANGTRREAIPSSAFVAQGRLEFPEGIAVPEGARVLAVPHRVARGRVSASAIRAVLESGTPMTFEVDAEGRFSLPMPGPEPLEESWRIIGAAPGWIGSVAFPDPRPNSPSPEMEFAIQMNAVFAATIEVKMADGSVPSLSRTAVRESGGPGLYFHRGWGTNGPARADSPTALLALPEGLPSLCGGQDPSIGFEGKELAVQVGERHFWKEGSFRHTYVLHLPGFKKIEQTMNMKPIALGEIPHFDVVLEPLGTLGDLQLQFDRSGWWRTELEPHDMSRLQISLKYQGVLAEGESADWTIDLDRIPDGGLLSLPGMLIGEYTISVTALETRVSLPVTPDRVAVNSANRVIARIDGGDLGVLLLEIPDGEVPEWASDRLEFMYVHEDTMQRDFKRSWPVRLGPLPAGEGVVLIRSLKRKTPPQVADRLNHSDEFQVIDGVTTGYTIVGVR